MNRSRPALRLALAVLLVSAGPGTVRAQSADGEPRGNVFSAGPSLRTWDVTDTTGAVNSIAQFYVPFTQTIAVGPQADIVAFGAYARTRLDLASGEEATLSGLSDLRLKAVWRPAGQAFIAAGIDLPAGSQTLRQGVVDGELRREVEVAQAMWSPILGFRARRMSAGFGAEVSAGFSTRLSPVATLGVGAGYHLLSEYDLLENGDGSSGGDTEIVAFKPGAEVSGSVGLSVRPAEGTLFRLDLAGRSYQDDETDGVPIFRAGTQIEVDAVFARAAESWSTHLRLRNVTRSEDETISDAGGAVVRTAIETGNSLWAIGDLMFRAGSSAVVGTEVQFGSFGLSEAVLSDGTAIAVGPAARLLVSEQGRIQLKALLLNGSATGGDTDLSGFDLSAALTVGF